MDSSNFYTVNLCDSRIAHIKSQIPFAVESGSQQCTFQSFPSSSISPANIIYNIQVPSMSTCIDRNVLQQATITATISCTNVPTGQLAFNYGMTDALQAFPLNSLITTQMATVNNTTVTVNLQDILPQVLRMYDHDKLIRYNSTAPSLPDLFFYNYSDAVGTQSNPLSSFSNMSFSNTEIPRGAFPIRIIQVAHFVGGAYTDTQLVSTADTDTWKIIIQFTTIEPLLALSPFCNSDSNDQACFLGINNMSLQFNIDQSCKRMFSSARDYITNIQLGATTQSVNNVASVTYPAFQACSILLNFLSLQPEQYAKINAKNVLSYLDMPRFLYSNSNALNAGQSQVIQFSNIQLNMVPDLMIIVARKPMAQQNWSDSSSFLTIQGITINFNNHSGILSSANQSQLYHLSQKNGSSQSWYEYMGNALANNNTTGVPAIIPSLGSLLVLNPTMDFGLDSMYSASSQGQFNLQFALSVYNQSGENFAPEICLICVNSGMFITENGTSQTQLGLLTREVVLKTKNERSVDMDSSYYKRLIGGNLSNLKALCHVFRKPDNNEYASNNNKEAEASGMCASGMDAGHMPRRLHRFVKK